MTYPSFCLNFEPLKKIGGPGVKLQTVCMPFILILIVMEMVISSLRSNYKTAPNSCINSKQVLLLQK